MLYTLHEGCGRTCQVETPDGTTKDDGFGFRCFLHDTWMHRPELSSIDPSCPRTHLERPQTQNREVFANHFSARDNQWLKGVSKVILSYCSGV